jgi:hypothetical protein
MSPDPVWNEARVGHIAAKDAGLRCTEKGRLGALWWLGSYRAAQPDRFEHWGPTAVPCNAGQV